MKIKIFFQMAWDFIAEILFKRKGFWYYNMLVNLACIAVDKYGSYNGLSFEQACEVVRIYKPLTFGREKAKMEIIGDVMLLNKSLGGFDYDVTAEQSWRKGEYN